MNSKKLSVLILNSIKEQIGLNKVINNLNFEDYKSDENLGENVSRYFKVTQRNYLPQQVFLETLSWLDDKSDTYIAYMLARCPISATT